MGKVHILSGEVISKIAAGEVIERPASVIKEFIENSIDAGSQSIELYIKQGGKTFINIKDSGTGIEGDDLEKIFCRHATSKINTLEDIYRINSLGFRGEALYSIAAVADIVLRSKVSSANTGWEVHLRGGEKLLCKPVNIPQGTEIEVRELFFNTPARRKFLKSDTAELQQILNIFIPYALLYHKSSFKLIHNNKPLLTLLPEDKLASRIVKTLNLEQKHLMEGQRKLSNFSFQLVLGDINIQRAKKDLQFIFVNNRPVYSRLLSFHLNDIYRQIFPQNVHPFFFVNISLPPETIDVNIHPSKREIKINNERPLIAEIRSLMEDLLFSYGKAKGMQKLFSGSNYKSAAYSGVGQSFSYAINQETGQQVKEEELPYITAENRLFEEDIVYEQKTLKMSLLKARYIGQFLKKYLLYEIPKTLLVIDQHAAQERIVYEKLKRQIEKGEIEIQNLLAPIIIKLTPDELIVWETGREKLERIGFSNTLWDNENIAIHSHPQLIANPEISIRNILAGENINRLDNETLARLSCRGSIMAGSSLNAEQAEYLRKELALCENPFACPHGRPVVLEIQENILDKQFGRK